VPLPGWLFGRFGCYSRGRHHSGRGLWFTSTTAGELFVADVGQTADFQCLGDAQQRANLFLINVYLALVHEVDDCPKFGPLDVFQYDDRVLALILGQHALEVWAACGQHDLVRFECMTVTGDRHVHERAVLQQLVEHVGQVALVVVPTQAELLVAGTACRAASLLGRRRRHVFGAVARLHGGGGGWMLLVVQCVTTRTDCREKKFRREIDKNRELTDNVRNGCETKKIFK